jgi:hypothetical protein
MEIANEVLDQTFGRRLGPRQRSIRASAQTYWAYKYGDAGPQHKVITGRRMMAVLNSAAAVAIGTAIGPATVMPAKRQAGGTRDAIESVAQ